MMAEAEMSPYVAEWLRERGLTVYAEVPHYYGSAIDLVGADLSKPFIVSVEMKIGFTNKLHRQALRAQYCSHEVWGCSPTKPSSATLDSFRKSGIGILRFQGRFVQEILKPGEGENRRSLVKRHYERILQRLRTHPVGGVGGKPCLLGEGPAKRVAGLVRKYISENPKATWAEIFKNVPNHYAHATSLSGTMSRWHRIVLPRSARAYKKEFAMSSPVELEIGVKAFTDKAVLADVDGDEVWLPLSQIDWGGAETPDLSRGMKATIWIPEWLAEEKGLSV